MTTNPNTFLARLQTEAQLQARLHEKRVFPPQLDIVTSFIGRHSWQVILFLAVTTSVILEVLGKIR